MLAGVSALQQALERRHPKGGRGLTHGLDQVALTEVFAQLQSDRPGQSTLAGILVDQQLIDDRLHHRAVHTREDPVHEAPLVGGLALHLPDELAQGLVVDRVQELPDPDATNPSVSTPDQLNAVDGAERLLTQALDDLTLLVVISPGTANRVLKETLLL